MSEHRIVIEDGHVRFIYDDVLLDLFDVFDAPQVCRVSHVEPHPLGGWTADMRPVGGPVLFSNSRGTSTELGPMQSVLVKPFKTRAEALAAERAWLQEHEGL